MDIDQSFVALKSNASFLAVYQSSAWLRFYYRPSTYSLVGEWLLLGELTYGPTGGLSDQWVGRWGEALDVHCCQIKFMLLKVGLVKSFLYSPWFST